MFLMFQLGRPDVWPVDDFGVRNGYRIAYELEEMPTAKQLEPLARRTGRTEASRPGTAGRRCTFSAATCSPPEGEPPRPVASQLFI